MTARVYKATSNTTHKSYIGFTEASMEARKNKHYYDASRGSQCKFHRAIREQGVHNWKWETLSEHDTRLIAANIEVQDISKHDTFKNGYNSTTGGENSWTHTEETRRRMSESTKANLPPTIFKVGSMPWNKGKTNVISESTREQMSDSAKKRVRSPHSQVTCDRISESNKGKSRTKEHSQNISAARMGIRYSQPKLTCPHCNKIGGASGMTRYHFDKCRS